MFSRGSRTSGRHARDSRARRGQSRPDRSPADELDAGALAPPAGGTGASQRGAGGGSRSSQPAADPVHGSGGPYDVSQAPAGVTRLDLGSLKIPSVPGVEVRVQANQQGIVQQVFLVHGDSALQLGAYAAPRTESIWDEVREEIRTSLVADGAAAEEVPGEYGIELRARRVRSPQGLKDLRFVGVSGPRWLLRAVYNGPAALDGDSARLLAECLRGVVVDRGAEAKPVKEPLPLQLPEQMAGQIQQQAQAQAAAAPAPPVNGNTATGGAPSQRKPSPRPRRQD